MRLQRGRVLFEAVDLLEEGLDHLGLLDVADRYAALPASKQNSFAQAG